MDLWETPVSLSFKQQCQHLLGDFFRELENAAPWFVSLGKPVNGEEDTCLYSLLGFDHEKGISFLSSLGLVKRGHSRNPQAISVVAGAWDKFLDEELLRGMMETITKTTVGNSLYYFIHYGKKSLLTHIPGEQFNGRVSRSQKGLYLKHRQRKFQKKLSELVTRTTLSSAASKNPDCAVIDEEEQKEEAVSSDEEDVKTEDAILGEHVSLSATSTPYLLKLFENQSKVPKSLLSTILLELFNVLGSKSTASIEFEYKNGNKGRAVIVPCVKDENSFRRQARRTKWIECCLEHLNDKNDAAQWMSYYLGSKYEGPFTLALEALGLPVVQRMDEQSTAAMWTDANINYTQQRIIKKHLRLHFGKRVFIPDNMLSHDHEQYYVPTYYNEYKYYKNGDKTQKPERCQYWCRDPSIVVTNEISRLLDYTDSNLIASKFSPLLSSDSCSLIAGADQGQGAWRSWIKIPTMSGEEVRHRMATEENFDIKSSYITAQVAHIVCKKDHHEILSNTVSERLSEGYENLISNKIIFVKPSYVNAKVQAVLVPKDSRNVRLVSKGNDSGNFHVTYQISGSSFTMDHCDETRFPEGSKIVLIMPSFEVFITGDLSFYADVLGMPNSSSYWCPWCLLSHPEWNRDPATFVTEDRTLKFLSETVEAIKNDSEKKMKPMDRKGVVTNRHYSCLGPKHFVPPLLHLEIGMVNQCWESFEQWVDDIVEIVPPSEKEARKELTDAKNKLAQAADEQRHCEATINVELREKSGAAQLIKNQLRRKGLVDTHRNELNMQLTLLATSINNLKDQMKACKENVKKSQVNISALKKIVATCREERGKPEASISADIETVLEKYKVSRAAYHGGDYNGVSCRRIVGNSSDIMQDITSVLQAKKDNSCSADEINEKMQQLDLTLGLLDAAFYYLNIPHPNNEEKERASEAVKALSSQWRKNKLSVTLKAHVMEQHVVPCNNKYGLGDKEESFIEMGHQIGLRENR